MLVNHGKIAFMLFTVFIFLVCDSYAQQQIAVSNTPAKFEKLAAQELKHFLEKISGDEYNIVPETAASGTSVIYLGQTEFARQHGINYATADKEEWILKTVGKHLVISGGRPIGTLYGVYAMLEKLGCHFLTLDQTVIPTISPLVLPLFDEQKKPFFAGRCVFDHYQTNFRKLGVDEDAYLLFRLRSRQNGGQGRLKALYLGDMFRLSYALPHYHNFYQYVSPDKYFTSHPEYFNMDQNGKRFATKSQGGQLCLSNPDVAQITLDSLTHFIQQDRKKLPPEEWPVLYDISAMDGTKFICLCPDCKAISNKEGSEAGLVLHYINAVARGIAKIYPEIMLRTFAYSSAELAPKFIRPEPNVIIQYADLYTRSDCYRPLTNPLNVKQLKKIEDWCGTNAKLGLWDYWNMGLPSYIDPPRPEVVIDAIQPDFKLFGQMGFVALFIEAEKNFITPQNFIDLEFFVAYKLMVDPECDVEKLINIYMDGYYGKAAPLMKKYLQLLRNGVATHPTAQFTLSVKNWHYMTPEFMFTTYKLLHDAENMVKDDEVYRRRVREELISPLWTTLYFRDSYKDYFKQNGIVLASLEQECRQLVMEFIDKFKPKNSASAKKTFEQRFGVLTANLPRPAQFSKLPESSVKVFGYPHHNLHTTRFHSSIVKDIESPTGYTFCSETPDPKLHGKENKHKKIWVTAFGVSNYGNQQKTIRVTDIPQDEKYHWYKIADFTIGSKTVFWGHCWWIQYDISTAYVVADGVDDANIWDVWFSAKFTGPAYVKDSTNKNAISVDRVVLVKPENLKKSNKG